MDEPALYIVLMSLHGLVRGRDPELGRDADTGGQVTYVLELARALGRHPEVSRVDLLTRRIEDRDVSPDYAVEVEPLGRNAGIVRLPFGPRRYLRKELLWGHLDTLVDRALAYFASQGRRPDLLHSHYADAGYVGVKLSEALGVPLVHTGHSLGRVKRRRLIASGRKESALERTFAFSRRIGAEEETLWHADLVVTSTRQEMREQYGLYDRFRPSRALVIPPGLSLGRFAVPRRGRSEPRAMALVDRFLAEPEKPMVLATGRPVEEKNLRRLVEAFGSDPELRQLANLAVVAGCRDDVRKSDEAERKLFTELLLEIDRHDLYGHVALPKRHSPDDVPELYRLAARRRGVFVDPALTEPFGLTLLEAAASGLPILATEDGGPKDILENCHDGLLLDPLDPASISGALRLALSDDVQWQRWSRNGVAGVLRHYTWDGHVRKYLKAVSQVLRRERKQVRRRIAQERSSRNGLLDGAECVLVTDIDETLTGDAAALAELLDWLRERRGRVLFGAATGRTRPLAERVLSQWKVPFPDFLITSVGAEIHYGAGLGPDPRWTAQIRYRWRREALAGVIATLPGLVPQPEEKQGPFKLSYDVDPSRMPALGLVEARLHEAGLDARLVYSQGRYLDLLPIRASKGLALRHLSYTHGVPLERFLVAGDSGNDIEMLLGDTRAVVVGNHAPELASLRGLAQIYFAKEPHAGGILEGIRHYGFGEPPAAVEEDEGAACARS